MSYGNCRFHLLFLAMISLGTASIFAAAPTVSVFSPTSGVLYSTVTITGTNFVAPVTVTFNGVASTSVTVVSSTTITAAVSLTASTGTITVLTSGGSATSAGVFTVVPGVAETPVTVGPPTTSLTLFYSGFGSREPVDFYFDTEDIALGAASTSGAGNLPFTIPATAHPGVHWITAVGRRSVTATQVSFTVRASWPQFGFQPNHKGKNRYENVLSAANAGDLDEAWQTPSIGQMYGSPAVVNGIVYASFSDGSIRAFDEITGAQKWSYLTGSFAGFSSPAVSNGIVYSGSGDDYLYALNAVTGTLIWRHKTGNIIYSSPNAVNGIVYVGSYDNSVYALNATTGAVIWTFVTGDSVFSSPMVANGVVYVGSFDKKVYALNAATGAVIWSFPTAGDVESSPVMLAGLVCVGSNDNNMYALRASTGELAWTYKAGGEVESSAAAVGGALIFGCDNGTVYSVSSGGVLLWSKALPVGSEISGPVCVANGVVYATNDANTYALDQNTGDLLTTLPVASDYGGFAVVNGALFAGDVFDNALTRFTPNGLLSNLIAPRPDPMQLRPHPLR